MDKRILKSIFGKRRVVAEEDDNAGSLVASHSVIYDHARGNWNDRIKEIARQRDLAYIAAGIAWVFAGSALGGVIYIGAQSKFVPYIVEIDKLNDAVLTAPVRPRQASPYEERAAIANWIINARSIISDPEGQNRNISNAWDMLSFPSPASQKFQEEREGDRHPYVRSQKELVSIDGSAKGITITVIGDTWTAVWTEVTRNPKTGQIASKKDWRMQIVTKRVPVEDLESALKNWTGLFITDYSASEVGGHSNG